MEVAAVMMRPLPVRWEYGRDVSAAASRGNREQPLGPLMPCLIRQGKSVPLCWHFEVRMAAHSAKGMKQSTNLFATTGVPGPVALQEAGQLARVRPPS